MDRIIFEGTGVRFSVENEDAEAMYLRLVEPDGKVRLLEMHRIENTVEWCASVPLAAGRYEYRYYIKTGAAFAYLAPKQCVENTDGRWDATLDVGYEQQVIRAHA